MMKHIKAWLNTLYEKKNSRIDNYKDFGFQHQSENILTDHAGVDFLTMEELMMKHRKAWLNSLWFEDILKIEDANMFEDINSDMFEEINNQNVSSVLLEKTSSIDNFKDFDFQHQSKNTPTDHHAGVDFPTVHTPIRWYSLAVQAGLRTWYLGSEAVTVAHRNIGKQNTKVALLILMQIFLHSMAIAEKQMNRYVVREGNSFAMDCKHELQNIKVVLWEFASNHNNRNEIIYDSQTKFLKPGFEVICEPQQALISTCIIKITQTKTDDSGKYICYVGEAEGKETMLEAVVEIELVIRGPKHQTMVVNNGDSVVLPCEHNITNLTRARWSHVSLQGVMTYQLYYMDWTEATNNNYEGLCKSHQLSCNLKILQANKESAGRYICMVGESREFEKKYGMDQMTYFVEIQLVVGELQCNENMNKDLTLLGENDCYGIEADVLNLKCSFNYFGNINYNLLHLRWIEKYKFNSLEKKLNSSLINHEVKDGTNKISIQTNLSVAYEMQKLQCALENSLVKPCHLHEFKVQYIKNTTKRLPPMYSNDLHNIKCSANKSSNVQCSYYWAHEIGGALVENPYAILPVENMNSPGNYTCIGKCHLGRNDCIIKAMEFEILQERTEILTVILYVACGLLAFVVVVVIALLLRGRFYKPRTDQDSQLLGSEKTPS